MPFSIFQRELICLVLVVTFWILFENKTRTRKQQIQTQTQSRIRF